MRLFQGAVLSLAAACAIAAAAAHGGRWNDRLDLLTHFAPAWLAGALLSLLGAMLLTGRWRAACAAVSVVGIAASFALLWVDVARLAQQDPAPHSAPTLKIIEFNPGGDMSDPDRVAAWIAAEDPDIVVLPQGAPALALALEATTGLSVFAGSGAIIGSRTPALERRVAWDARFLAGGPTALAWIELPAPDGGRFTVVGVHSGRPIPARDAWGDVRKITALVQTLDRSSLVLAGDFNSTQWSFRNRVAEAAFALERRDRFTPTWPERVPIFRNAKFPVPVLSIDHIYAGSSWKTVSVRRGPRLGSDHYPLVATLAWDPP
jgi:endonuclease/exonuclease/phosphatase (EEP) superfamily protein YafD